jgi:O-acetyl-ADP-ribose deacetylase (regulator of RNase III)
MPITIIDGDLFDTKAEFICHQVNCMGRMGSGVAKQVREKFPKAYRVYSDLCNGTRNGELPFWMLGKAQFVTNENGITIVNMFSQGTYGYDGKKYTDYNAFRSCLRAICNTVPKDAAIAMPYKIGCGLGGGDWDTIMGLIEEELPDHKVELWRKEV